MKIKYIVAGALVAMFAIPGTASQLAARAAASAPQAAALGTAGLFSDPDVASPLSIVLPTRFKDVDVSYPLARFHG